MSATTPVTSPPSPPLVDPIDTVTATDRLLSMTGIDEFNSEVTHWQHGLGMFVSLHEHDPVTLRGTPPPTEALRLLRHLISIEMKWGNPLLSHTS